MTIPEIILKMNENKFGFGAMICKVLSVSGSTCEVLCVERDVELKGVRLQTEVSAGVLLKPAVDSFVVVVPIADFEFVVVMYSAIDEIQLLDGSFGGLVKVSELVDKVNALEDQVNDLLTALQGVTIPLAPSGSYPFAPLFTSFTPLTPTTVSDLENDKITHGTT
jgi:hypothetical protein